MVCTSGGRPPAAEEPEGEAGTVACVMVVVATEVCEDEYMLYELVRLLVEVWGF